MSIDKITSQSTLRNLEQTYSNASTLEKKQVNAEIENQAINDSENLNLVVKGLNDFLQPTNTHIKFELHDELNEYYVTIVDDKTSEIIKEIPAKRLLDIYSQMTEYMGLLFDKKI